MSTERSRQRAIERSANAKTTRKSQKCHFTAIYCSDIDLELQPGIVLAPRFLRTGPKAIISDGTHYNIDGLKAHLLFWDRVVIP